MLNFYKVSNFTNSDHLPQILQLRDDFAILTWNILSKCMFHKKHSYFNNGFGKIEKDDEYVLRLKSIAKDIADIVAENQSIKCIALQEIPTGFHKETFSKILNETLNGFSTIITHQNQGFIYDKNFKIKELTQSFHEQFKNKMTIHDKLQYFALYKDQKEFNIVNVHLAWGEKNSDFYKLQVNLIHDMMRTLPSNTIITGDFNLNILELNLKNAYAIKDTTLVYKISHSELETCDGFIVF